MVLPHFDITGGCSTSRWGWFFFHSGTGDTFVLLSWLISLNKSFSVYCSRRRLVKSNQSLYLRGKLCLGYIVISLCMNIFMKQSTETWHCLGALCNEQNCWKNVCSRKISVVTFLISAFFASIMEILYLFLLGIFFVRGRIYLLLLRVKLYANCFGKMPVDLVTVLYIVSETGHWDWGHSVVLFCHWVGWSSFSCFALHKEYYLLLLN